MSNGFLEDIHGNKSSKCLFGSIMVDFAMLFSLVLFIDSLLIGAADAPTALSIINMLLIIGGWLLGIGIFEKPKQ